MTEQGQKKTSPSAYCGLLRSLVWALAWAALLLLVPELAYATDTPIGDMFCSMVKIATGNAGKGVCTICVITLGILQLRGDRKLRSSILVPAAICVVFTAASIVSLLAPTSGNCT